jgi:hypothetical protein
MHCVLFLIFAVSLMLPNSLMSSRTLVQGCGMSFFVLFVIC